MDSHLQSYEDYLHTEKKCSANTMVSYMRDTSVFLEYLRLNNIQIKAVNAQTIDSYLNFLSCKGNSTSTLQRNKSSVSSFLGFMLRRGIVNQNPVKGVKTDLVKKHTPSTLTVQQVDKLLTIDIDTGAKGLRDRAMLELMYATGIKVGELIVLDLGDIDTKIGLIRCKSGKKIRIIPLYSAAAKLIEQYIVSSRKYLVDTNGEQALFVNTMGYRMTRQGFWKILKHYAKLAGIECEITPQIIRHSFAMHLLQNGADLKSLQEVLGHSDIATTQIYMKRFNNDLVSKMERFHPRAAK